MQKKIFVLAFLPIFFSLSLLVSQPASAAGPVVGAVSPISATAGVPVVFTASVSSGSGIKSCNLHVDLEDMGAMDISGNTASKSYTFSAGGSRIAFVFCRDNSGGMASGPNTSIWVQGATVDSAPLTSSQPSSGQDSQVPPAAEPAASPSVPAIRRLVKLECADGAEVDDPCRAVYYVGTDSKRHAYPNSKVFFSWYADFGSVETVGQEVMSLYPLGKNVTYRPGVRMVKFTTLAKVYAVGQGGLLRWITSEEAATALYGKEWNTKIDDLPDTVYADYSFGTDISSSADYSAASESAAAPTFD
jgi:hypothetical protein